MGKIAIFFAEGYEEIEALAVVDVCRRLKLEIDMVSITAERKATGSHGISVEMDKVFDEIDCGDYDMLILPGGMPGTKNLEAFAPLMEQVDAFYEKGKYIGAICAAPSVFGHRGFLRGRKACCYPGFESHLEGAEVSMDKVVVDGNVVTSRGMGTAIEFGLTIGSLFVEKEQVEALAQGIIHR